jgi:hypothetical protein
MCHAAGISERAGTIKDSYGIASAPRQNDINIITTKNPPSLIYTLINISQISRQRQ